MRDDGFDAERYVEESAALMRIPLAPERRRGVAANLEFLRTLYDRIEGEAAEPLDPLAIYRP